MQIVTLRRAHLLHRWLGIGLGLLVLLWFLSGLVMLFVGYPTLTSAERLQGLRELDLQAVRVSPQQALLSATMHKDLDDKGLDMQPLRLRLAMLAGRPVYHVLRAGKRSSLWADNGRPVLPTATLATQAALDYEPHAGVRNVNSIAHDQWSISSSLDSHRPLYRVELDDTQSTVLYVSSRSGEVVLDTHGNERAWNWVGSVIHWVYFTPLRMERAWWRQIVMCLACGGMLLAALGLWLGWQRVRLKRRYCQGSVSPYRGWKYMHHLLGLSAGVFCLTWLFSGWLSLTPLGWFSARNLTSAEAQAWAGGLPALPPMQLPSRLAPSTREIEWIPYAGSSYTLARSPAQDTLVDSKGNVLPVLSLAALRQLAGHLQPASAVAELVWLPAGDAYFKQDNQRVLQLARVTLDDAARTSYYIDASTRQIVATQDNSSRVYRWLFDGLHKLDLPPLGQHLLARRISIITLSIGGILLTLAGLVIGWRRLRH